MSAVLNFESYDLFMLISFLFVTYFNQILAAAWALISFEVNIIWYYLPNMMRSKLIKIKKIFLRVEQIFQCIDIDQYGKWIHLLHVSWLNICRVTKLINLLSLHGINIDHSAMKLVCEGNFCSTEWYRKYHHICCPPHEREHVMI